MPAPIRRVAVGQAAARAAHNAAQVAAPAVPQRRTIIRPAPAPAAAAPVAAAPRPVARVAQPQVVREQAHGYSSVSQKDRKGTLYENHQEVNDFLVAEFSEADPAAFVRVSGGMTINLQNFESLRIDCSITLPCKRTDVDAAYDMASQWVANKMQQEEQNYLGSTSNTEQPGRAR